MGLDEKRKMMELYDWHKLVVAAAEPSFRRDGPAPRKLITMEQMRAGMFCDLVVEVSCLLGSSLGADLTALSSFRSST